MTASIVLLTDFRGSFFTSTTKVNGVDIPALRAYFERAGYTLDICPYAAIDLQRHSFAEHSILYQSAEDLDLHYRSFLEDILLALQLQGARLIPPFEYCRAHHNKVFMELLRATSSCPALRSVQARVFGTFEDFLAALPTLPVPAVLKPAAGAGSAGVVLARTATELVRAARRLASSPGHLWWHLKDHLARFKHPGYIPLSRHRCKFIVQPYIPNLCGDFKVLIFGDKYYVLYRANRPGDFRASGSGRFVWPDHVPDALLDTAKQVFSSFHVPYLSLDIAWDGAQYHVLEFQFVSFGPLTLQRSTCFFHYDAGAWHKHHEQPCLERELAASVIRYVEARPPAR